MSTSLIACPDCELLVVAGTTRCPHCERSIAGRGPRLPAKAMLLGLTATLGVASACVVGDMVDPTGMTTDADGDGFDDTEDCDDENADIFPGATETPGDEVDSNCDGADDT